MEIMGFPSFNSKNKKVVWILNHYAVTPDLPGGTRHFDLGKRLVEKGCRVIVFASGFDHQTKRYLKISPEEKVKVEDYEGVCFVWLKTTSYYGNDWRRVLNMFSYGLQVLKRADKFTRPDVVIGSSMHPVAAFTGWFLARMYRARFVFEVRDLWPQTAVDMGAISAASFLARMLYAWERFMYQRAEKIVVLLPHARDYIEKKGISSDKIVWIPNGVDLERFDKAVPVPPDCDAMKVLQNFIKKFKVLYTGAHGPVNGLDVVIDAAALLQKRNSDVHIFLVGDGPEKKKLMQRAYAKKLDNISFLPPIPKAYIPLLLKKADVLLHCHREIAIHKYGVSPNKISDYLASRKPVIMSGMVSNDIISEAKAGITVEPGNPLALANAIIRLQKMPAREREQLGLNGRAYVEKYYDIKVLGDRLFYEVISC